MLNADEIASLAAGVAAANSRDGVFGAIERIASVRMKIAVFSVSTCNVAAMELERIYSSRPDVYPAGIRKSKRETAWGEQVLKEQRVFVGEGPLEMAAAFDDQERMASLGVRSIINVPVVVSERCLGVLNFARSVERVLPADVSLARVMALCASVVFMRVP